MRTWQFVVFAALLVTFMGLGMYSSYGTVDRTIQTAHGPQYVEINYARHTVSYGLNNATVYPSAHGLRVKFDIPWRWGVLHRDVDASTYDVNIYNAAFPVGCS